MLDLLLAATLIVTVITVRIAYSVRGPHPAGGWLQHVAPRERSSLLGRGAIEATYWAIKPLTRRLVGDGVSANAITGASVAFGGAAGVALSSGHFGLGAWFAASSALCDTLDGPVARMSGTASTGGKVLDASMDRYSEYFFLAGLALYFRTNVWMLAVVLLALHGSFMVSFAEAKAEGIARGWMGRPDRAALLIAGAVLSALAGAFEVSRGVMHVPLLAALFVDSLGANISAARRIIRAAAQLDADTGTPESVRPTQRTSRASITPPMGISPARALE